MGRSTNVRAFICPDDEEYRKQAAVLKACANANVELPDFTSKYFGSDFPEEYLLEEKLEIEIKTHEYHDDCSEGYEIYVSDIPEGTYKIRFYNSW